MKSPAASCVRKDAPAYGTMPHNVGVNPRKKLPNPLPGVTVLIAACVASTVAPRDLDIAAVFVAMGSGGLSRYIFLHISRTVTLLLDLVSQASRTLITSSGYVLNTEHIPARLPAANRRYGVSCSLVGITTARTCSYARNLIPPYGKMRSNVAECPRKRPPTPLEACMSRIAFAAPLHDPMYFSNLGLLAWKRILTRSSGATTVFAAQAARPPATPERTTYSQLCLGISRCWRGACRGISVSVSVGQTPGKCGFISGGSFVWSL